MRKPMRDLRKKNIYNRQQSTKTSEDQAPDLMRGIK